MSLWLLDVQASEGSASSEGELSEGGSEGEEESSSSEDELATFNDGLGDDLIRDEEDRQKLASMTEAEREQEIFKRLYLTSLIMQ